MVVKNIKKTLFRLFFYVGVIPRRLATPEQFYLSLHWMPVLIKEHELKKYVDLIVKANSRRYYELLLSTFVKEWKLNIGAATFIGRGLGEGSLNIYRKVSIDENTYFEKVFFNSRPEAKTAEWFGTHIYHRLKDRIVIPELKKIARGNLITIAYYEFLELCPFAVDESEQEFINLTIDIYLLSNASPLDMDNLDIPAHIGDFRFHFQYQRNAYAAEEKLRRHGVDFEKWIARSAASKKILTHGDINPGNAFKNSILVDWDSFGIYPIGLEVAYLYYRMPVWNKRYSDPSKWLKDNYKTIIDRRDWSSFESNFFFFLYIFAFHLLQTEDYHDLETQIIVSLREFNEN